MTVTVTATLTQGGSSVKHSDFRTRCAAALLVLVAGPAVADGTTPAAIAPDWGKIVGVSRANASIEVCVEPPLRRGHPIHDRLFGALRELGADYAHFQPWNVFPRLAVAELAPPSHGRTSWDFSLMDPIAEDFMHATAGHPVIFNIGTLPAWMFRSKTPVVVSDDPDEPHWSYSVFNERHLSDESISQAAAYQARLADWYVNGGFTDELGVRHDSGHHYDIAYWEVLNEPDFEGNLQPADYTRLYDAIVEAVRTVAPRMKFMGPVVGDPLSGAGFFLYFLDPGNHKPGIPIDMLSYHMFALAEPDETPDVMVYTVFQQADKFLTAARYIDALRRRFAPDAKTAVDNIATMLPDPLAPVLAHPIPRSYWNLSGAMYAYMYGNLALMGADMVGASELIDYPGMAAASTLVDWDTGVPNARYWVLKLLRDTLGPGDRIVAPIQYSVLQPDPAPQVYVQAFVTHSGQRRILLVNKRNSPVTLTVSGAAGGYEQHVDQMTEGPAARAALARDTVRLSGLAVSVVTLP